MQKEICFKLIKRLLILKYGIQLIALQQSFYT